MSKYSNTVEYKIKTSLDATGLTKLQQQLRQVQAEFERMSTAKTPFYGLEEAKKQLTDIQRLVNSSFNAKLGMMDTKALTAGLSQINGGLTGIYKNFSAAGVVGKQAFAGLLGQTSKLDAGLKQVSSTSDKIFNTLGNTVRWGLIASAFSSVMNAAHESVQYVKDLDESLTNIMMVTEYSRDAMNDYAKAANEAAKSLGSTTTAMTNATLVFAQQGFDLPKSQQLAETSTQLANISQQDTATASDEITAYMNAFHLESIDEINNAMSKWAIVANVSAADVQELSIASQKAASTAVTVGVNMDQLAAQIAAIETVTREAPENIGNGLKTLYARLSDIGMGETVDGDVNLGKVTSTLEKVGVQVLTAEGNMRQVGDIMEDLMEVWGGLDLTQRTSIATTLAGKYQLSRFTALMNRSDLYNEYLNASEGETGTETFDEMQTIFEDSMQGRLNKLQAAIEGIFTNAFNTDSFYDMIDAVTNLVEVFGDLTEAIGGGGAAMTAFLAVAAKMFSGGIGKGIANFISNRQTNALADSNRQALAAQAKRTLANEGLNTGDRSVDVAAMDFANMNQYRPNMTAEQSNQANALVEQRVALLQEEIQLREDLATQIAIADAVSGDAEGKRIQTQEQLLEYARKLKLELAEMDPKSLEQSAPIFNKAIESLERIQKELQKVKEGFDLINQGQETAGWDKIINTNAIKALEDLRTQLNLTGEEDLELIKTIELLSAAFDGQTVDLERLKQGLSEAGVSTDQLRQQLERAFEQTNMQSAALIETRDRLVANAASQEMNQTQTRGIGEQVETQEFATGVANAAGNIGQLIFAWQSFQGLGGLWANADMDLGQKVEETILNLAMGLPMLITGFTQLKSAISGLDFGKFANQIQMSADANKDAAAAGERNARIMQLEAQAEQARQRGAVGTYTQLRMKIMAEREDANAAADSAAKSGLAGVSYRAQGVAATAAATGVRALGAAMNFLASGPGIALVLGLTAVSTVLSFMGQAAEEAKQKHQELFTEAQSNLENIESEKAAWEDLYNEWKKTGEVTDEFKQSTIDLANQLGISGAEAAAAAGNFDSLAEKIDKAQDAAARDAIAKATSVLGDLNLDSGSLTDGSSVSDYKDMMSTAAIGGTQAQTITSMYQAEEGDTFLDTMRKSQQALDDLQAAKEKLNNTPLANRDEQWEREIESIDRAIGKIQEYRSREENTQGMEAYQAKAENTTQLTEFQNQLKEVGGDAQKIYDTFANNPDIGNYFTQALTPAEQLDFMIQHVTDSTQKMLLMTQQVGQDSMQNLYQLGLKAGDSSEMAAQGAESIMNQASAIGQEQGFSDDQMLTLYAKIGEAESIEEINEGLRRVKESGNIEDFEINAKLNEQSVKDQIENMSTDDLDESIDVDQWKDLAKYISETAEEMEGFSEELEDNAKASGEVAEEMLRYDAALEEAHDKMDDWQDALDSGVMEEEAQAASELNDVYGDLLDLADGTDLSAAFTANPENLELLQRAMEGDSEAYDELAARASQDILVQAGFDEQQALDSYNRVQGLLDAANFDDLEIGAAINSTGLEEELNGIIQAAGMTAEQAESYLASMGIDAELEPIKQEENLPQTYVNWETEVVPTAAVQTTTPTPDGGTQPGGSIQSASIITTPKVETADSKVASAAFGMKVTGASSGKSSGGNIKIKSGSMRKAATGAAKYRNASNGAGRAPSGGGGGGGGSCFIAGTLISMHGYYKNIEDIVPGDIVLSYNEKLECNEYSTVVQTMIHKREERLHTFYVANDKITSTHNHKFFVIQNGKKQWLAAENLRVNDLMLLADGSWHKIHIIVVKTKFVTTYNFEVSNNHNYYVGKKQILAHNKKKSCFVAGTEIAMRGYYKNIEDIKTGDIVLSYNEELHKNQYSTVLQTMIHDTTEELYNLYIENEKLTVTGIHRFLISRNDNIKWIPASELKIGDKVLFANGTWHRISIIVVSTQTRRVYNFEVSNNHNYYVGRNQILAHNKGGGSGNKKKKVDKEQIKKVEAASAENDIYEKVNATLKKLEDQYSQVEKVANRLWGEKRRKDIEAQLALLDKEKVSTQERLDIAKAYIEALKTGKDNLDLGINMQGKDTLKKYGLTDADDDGVIDNYIQKFEDARLAAQAADKAAEDLRKSNNAKLDKLYKQYGNGKMTDKQKEAYDKQKDKLEAQYEKATEKAKELWEKAEAINDVTKDYEDTWAQVREDEEALIELQQKMEDLAIDLYEKAVEATDQLKELRDVAAEIAGWQSGFGTDSPFRDLIEDAQRLSDMMRDDSFDIEDYFGDKIAKLESMRDQFTEGTAGWNSYNEAITAAREEMQAWQNDAYGVGTGELGQAMIHLNELQRWFSNPAAMDNPYGTNEAGLLEAYEEQYKKVTDLILEAEERMEAMQKSVVDTMEESADRQEKVLEKYKKIQDDLERTADRVALWQGDDAYKAQADIAKQMAATAKAAAEGKKALYDTWKAELEAQKALEDANRQAKIDLADNQVKELQALLNSQAQGSLPWLDTKAQLEAAKVAAQRARTDYSEAVDTLQEQVDDLWEQIKDDQDEAAEAMQEAYLATIDEINAAMTERLFGDRNLSNLTDDWDWDKDYFTTYKDTVEEAYEKEKLRLKYMDFLDDAQGMSLGIQRQIRDAMNEQLALLDDQATVSQYDVDLANARLEILQKQIALENAQQNKTQMKLRRDTQGNYKYVYSADQDNVRDKESELLDAQFDAYEMSKDANRDSYDSAISMYNQYVEQRKALAEKYQDDREKLDEELKKLDENYTRAAKANAEDLQNSYDGMVLSVEWMAKSNVENIANMTDEVLEGLKEHNQEALEAIGIPWNDAIGNAIEDFEKIQEEAENTSQDLIDNADEFGKFISGDEGIGAITGEQYGQAKEAIDSAKEATEGLKIETENLNKALTQELGATSAAEEKIAEYEQQLTKAKESSSALTQRLNKSESDLVNVQQELQHSQAAYQKAEAESATFKRQMKGDFRLGDTVTLKKGTTVYYGRGGKQEDSQGNNSWKLDKDYSVKVAQVNQRTAKGEIAPHHVGLNVLPGQGIKLVADRDPAGKTRLDEQWHLSPEEIKKAMGYDTGGYTGTWDDTIFETDDKGGRLAWLHQKELVLNETDTQNILLAVDVVRQITEGLKGFATSAGLQSLNSFAKQTQGDTIEQRVEITAEFPNANSAEEIKQALLGLADSAMQYSYREKNLIG